MCVALLGEDLRLQEGRRIHQEQLLQGAKPELRPKMGQGLAKEKGRKSEGCDRDFKSHRGFWKTYVLYFDGVYGLKKREVGDDTREIKGGDGGGY